MFVSSRDSSIRRRSKVYGSIKGARSSKLSLMSTFTITTNSSGGSNSTVTQDSYNRSQHKQRRRRQHRSRRPESRNASVDVFDFLVEDGSQENLVKPADQAESVKSGSEDSEDDDSNVKNIKTKPAEEGEPERYYRSMSDSGISMSSAGDHPKRPPLVVEEPYNLRPPDFRPRDLALVDPRVMWPPFSPQPRTDRFIPPPCPPPPPAVMLDHMYSYRPYTPYDTPPAEQEGVRRVPALLIREPVINGKEIVNQSSKPSCFRPFTKLSARLLLQMQDEIADLEAELKLLDEETDIADRLDERHSASRHETRIRQDRESDIYEELHVKLENYCMSLKSCGTFANNPRPRSRDDWQG